MTPFKFVRWLKSLYAPRLKTYEKKPRLRLKLEELEHRLAPATHIWTGGAGLANNGWNLASNWNLALPASANFKDADGQYPDLVFPAGPSVLISTNNLSIANGLPIYKSITISGNNYLLKGNALALGDPAASLSSAVNINNGTLNAEIDFDIQLGGPAVGTNQQFFTVGSGASLIVKGHLSSASSNPQLTKEGSGILTLTNDNSAFTGPITIDTNGGIVNIQNANALGSNTTIGTTVDTNAQLQLQLPVIGTNTLPATPLTLNGFGTANSGALLNVSGTNVLPGNVVLDSSPDPNLGIVLGANAASSLNISGVISDLGVGQALTKEGKGQVIFSNDNTYRGLTTINNGILTITRPLALGSAASGTIVNSTLNKTAELQLAFTTLPANEPGGLLQDPTKPFDATTNPYIGFVVLDEALTLNGLGFTGLGALANASGNNNYAAPITVASAVSFGAAAGSTLTASGVIGETTGVTAGITKVDAGTVVFNNANTYVGTTTVAAGILDIRDSQALGKTGGPGTTTVTSGATLELEVDGNTPYADPHGRDLTVDSVVGQTGNGPQIGLTLSTDITLSGSGVKVGGNFVGALYSHSGINRWNGKIVLAGAPVDIGVDPDPNASTDGAYFTHDYSLTVNGLISGVQLEKVGTGQLILPRDNTYIGGTNINQGWVTIETAQALGGRLIAKGDTAQPITVVADGAALHLKPLTGNLNLVDNLVLSGTGITHPFAFISQKGALMNLSGDNVVGSAVLKGVTVGSGIQLGNVTGIGVEALGPQPISNLTITAPIADAAGSVAGGGITKFGSLTLSLQGPGTFSGPVDVREGVLRVQNDTALGQSSSGTATGSDVFTTTTTTVEAGAGLQLGASIAANNGGLSDGIQVANEHLVLNGAGAQIAVAGPSTGGTFTLSYTDAKGVTTTSAALAYPLPATSSDSVPTSSVQNALNALLTSADPGGTAAVTLAGNVYTIVFGGNLAGVDPSTFLSAAGLGGVSLTVNGTGSALKNLSNDRAQLAIAGPATGGTFTLSYTNNTTNTVTASSPIPYGAPVSVVQGALTALLTSADAGGTGTVTPGGNVTTNALVTQAAQQYTFFFDGNLRGVNPASFLSAAGAGGVALTLSANQAADTMWRGPVTLATDSNIDVGYNSRLTLYGAIDDGAAGAGFTKLGLGELALNGANTYRGITKINQGVVTVESSQALGAPVGGTVVANGATLQTLGNVTIGGEPLTLMGSGLGAAPTNVPVQWFNAGPAPINKGPTLNNLPVSGRVTGIAVDPSDANVIYIATAGGGAWKTIDDGKSWHPLFDNAAEAQVTVSGTAGGFTLTFNGFTTPASGTGALAASATADQVRTALNLLPSISGVGGSVNVTANAITGGMIYTITYGGSLAQANVPALTATTTGSAVVTAGTLNPSIFSGAIAIDPTDPRIIYLGTGEANNSADSYYGTGVYKSTDSGRTWSLLFDPAPLATLPGNPIYGLAISKIVVDPTAGNNVIYVATSDQAQNVPPTLKPVPGVYRFDGNTSTWFNLTGTPSLVRNTSPGQLMAPPKTPGPDDDFTLSFAQSVNTWSDLSLVYVNKAPVLYAAQGLATGSLSNAVYRTATPDPLTSDPKTAPVWLVGTPGPAKDEVQEITITGMAGSVQFYFPGPAPKPPGTIAFNYTPPNGYDPNAIAAAIAALPGIKGAGGTLTVSGVVATPGSLVFDVTFGGKLANTYEPLIDAKFASGTTFANVILVQGGNADSRSAAEFPTGGNGNIKFAANGAVLYAAIAKSGTNDALPIETSTDGGLTWAATAASPNLNYMGGQGNYASTIAIDPKDPKHVFVAGFGQPAATGPWETKDSGATWIDQGIDIAGNGPQNDYHASAFDANGNVLFGTDGGVFTLALNPATRWNDLNGNLAITQFTSVSPNPSDTSSALGGSPNSGTVLYSGSQAWTATDVNPGGRVQFDPQNPAIAYHALGGALVKSTDGGQTWGPTALTTATANFPFLVDSINNFRILAGGASLQESLDGGVSFAALVTPIPVTALGAASYQGTYNADLDLAKGFATVADKGANSYDPGTIYVTNGTKLYVTKDLGNTWRDRTVTGTGGFAGTVQAITVDAGNRDTAYVVVSSFTGGGRHVWLTTNGGLLWKDITGTGAGALPDVPVFALVVDPRHNAGVAGDVYVGTDNGVYQLPGGGAAWARFGVGMPDVQVHDLQLNQSSNTLTAGTYGRSMFQLFLSAAPAANAAVVPGTPPPPVYGAFRVVTGSAIWTGPITLVGDTVISAGGSQTLQNGFAPGQLNIVGVIQDPAGATTFGKLTKIGQGNVTLSGSNTYAGVTEINQGVVIAQNPNALGAAGASADTLVDAGTALDLASDLALETIHLQGNGILFNGHYTGALQNISNNNTFTGTLVLDSNSTIGVNSASSLNIGIKSGLAGTGTIVDGLTPNFSLTKELTGTLILAGANIYTGATLINQGVLQIQNSQALGAATSGTTVLDGAQLQLQTPTTGPNAGQPVAVTGEDLLLSGAGIAGSGALLNSGGSNSWSYNGTTGAVTLTAAPVLLIPSNLPATTPPGDVVIDVSNAADTLTINAPVGQSAGTFGLQKIGLGRLTLTSANTYTGAGTDAFDTTVSAGSLRIQNAAGLGGTTLGTQVLSGAALEVDGDPAGTDTVTFAPPSGTVALAYNGAAAAPQATFAYTSVTTAFQLQNYLATIPALAAAGAVTVTGANGGPFNVFFSAGLTGGTALSVVSGSAQIAQPGITVTGESLSLSGSGIVDPVTRIGAGVLRNISGVNTWQDIPRTISGNLTLQTNAVISVNPGTQLTVASTVQDPTTRVGPVPIASLTKAGTGTLVFPNANTYAGKTVISAGILNIQNAGSLGGGGPEQNILNVTGPNGTFVVNFNGAATTPIDINSPTLLADITNALNSLPTISGPAAGGFVTVVQAPAPNSNIFIVTFAGNLAVTNVPQLTIPQLTGGANVITSVLNDGPEGTLVQSGATLQLHGGINVPNEALTLNGTGFNNAGALESVAGNNTWQTNGNDVVAFTLPSGPVVLAYNGAVAPSPNQTLSYTSATPAAALLAYLNKIPGLQGNVNVSGSNGGPFQVTFSNGANPALLSSLSGPVQISYPLGTLTLGSSTTISVDRAQDTLTLATPVTDATHSFGTTVTKSGPGTLDYQGTNTYTGLTQVNQGTLLLDDNAGSALNGNLTIAAGTTVKWIDSNQVPDTATVTNNGTLNLNGQSDIIGPLVMVDSQATTGPSGALTVSSLNMTGSTFTLGAGGKLSLGGDVIATSDLATGTATIAGPGTLSLANTTNTTRAFTVNHGAAATVTTDLDINAVITGAAGAALTKNGLGRLELDKANTYPGMTTVTAGDLQVDGAIGDVTLNGAGVTLSGIGNVGTIIIGVAGGTVSPGDNGSANPVGVLTSTPSAGNANTDVFTPATSLVLDLPLADGGVPAPAHDQLVVNGSLVLGGANLIGTVGSNIAVFSDFTIIQATGTITPRFAEPFLPNTTFVNDRRLAVSYNPHSVVLQLVKANVAVKVTASANPSVYGQDVTYTVTVTPQIVKSAIPAADTVTFHLTNAAHTISYSLRTPLVNNKATFDPQALNTAALPIGSYELDVTFNGDATLFNAGGTGAITEFTNGISPSSRPDGITSGSDGNLWFVEAGAGKIGNITPANTGVVEYPLTAGSVPTSIVQGGDGNFWFTENGRDKIGVITPLGVVTEYSLAAGSGPLGITSGPDGKLWFTENTGDRIGTITTAGKITEFSLTAGSAPSQITTGSDGNLWFTETGSAKIGQITSKGIVTEFNLTSGTMPTSITAGPDGNLWFTEAGTNAIGRITPAGSLAEFNSGLTASSGLAGITSGPDGNLWFTENAANQIGQITTSGAITEYSAGLTPGSGPKGITTGSDGNLWFTENSGSALGQITPALLSQTVTVSPTTMVVSIPALAAPQPVYAQAVTVTATITPTVAPSPKINALFPSGTATFTLDGVVLPPVTLNSAGQALLPLDNVPGSYLTVGAHRIAVTYNTDGRYSSTATTTDFILNISKDNTAVTVAASSNPTPALFGQPVTLTAAVAAAFGVAHPTGTVSFYDGAAVPANLIGAPANVDPITGIAGLTTSALATNAAPGHTITAVYSGDGFFFAGNTGTPLQGVGTTTVVVSPIGTQVVLAAGTPNPSNPGQTISFVATVSALAPSTADPTSGTVNFYDGASPTPIGSAVVGANHQANLTIGTLAGGMHTITAVYQTNAPNYNASLASHAVNQVVLKNATITVTPSTSTPVFGQPVTYTIVVTDTPAGGAIPQGTVSFSVDGTALPPATPNPVTLDSTGKASFAAVNLGSAGPHTITVTYASTDAVFVGSASSGMQTVGRANTSATLSVAPVEPPNAVYGQPVTFTATVATALPSTAAAPATGTVSFFDGGNLIGTAKNVGAGGVATITTTGLATGSHVITAIYNGDNANYAAGLPTTLAPNYQVDVAATNVLLASSPNPAGTNFPVTFTATVTAQGPSVVNPTGGTVQFYDGAVSNPANLINTVTNNNTGNVFTFTTTSLSSSTSPHNITAVFVTNSSYTGNASNIVSEKIIKSPTITITPSTSLSVFGQPVSYTIHVTDTPASASIPTGTVSLSVDGTPVAAATPNPVTIDATGTATFSGITLGNVGPHTVAIVFSSTDTVFAGNNASLPQTVGLANTVTAVSAAPANAVYGQPLTFTATVQAAGPSLAAPPTSGNVDFYDGPTNNPANLLGTQALSNAGSGVAVLTLATPTLLPNTYTINAIYRGDSASYAANAVPGTLAGFKIAKAGSSTTVTGTWSNMPANPILGQPITLSATVTAATPSTGLPPTAGTVNFFDNGSPFGTAQTINAAGVATLPPLTLLSAGNNSITAVYNGNSLYAQTSAPNIGALAITEDPFSPSIAVTANVSSPIAGTSVTFTASITAVSPGTGVPTTGQVTFYTFPSGTQLGAVQNVINGMASVTTSALPPGLQTITAKYTGGNGNFAPGQGSLNNYQVFQSNTIGNQVINDNQGPLVINMAPAQSYQLRQAGTRAWFLNQDYGLFFGGSYYQNSLGNNEKWVKGNAAPVPGIPYSKGNPYANVWYFILPNGNFYAWNSAAPGLQGTLLASLDPIYYSFPSMLHDASQENYAYTIYKALGLFNPGNFYENFNGLQERWIRGGNTWYYITPNGKFYTGSGTFLASLDPIYYNEPSRLYNAQPLQVGPNLVAANPGATVTQPGPGVPNGVFTLTPAPEYVGQWIVELTTVNLGITFSVERFTVTVVDNPPVFTSTVSPQLLSHASTSALPITLNGSDPDGDPLAYTATAGTQGYALQSLYNLHFAGSYYTNFLGLNEKWLKGNGNAYNNPWYIILPNGQFFAWNGSTTSPLLDPLNNNNPMVPLTTLDQPTVYWTYPTLLYQNTVNNDFNYALQTNLGLHLSTSLYYNIYNYGESWLRTASGGWVYILANGQMYQWGGSRNNTQDTLLATLPVLATDITSQTIANRLLNASAGQLANVLQVAGNVVTVTPGTNFYGDIWTLAGVTDDASYVTPPGNNRFAYQIFKTTVTA